MKYTKEQLEKDLLDNYIAVFPTRKFEFGRYGKVTRVDEYCRLHGTWSDEIVEPGVDIFEAVGQSCSVRDKYINIHKQ